MHDPDDILRFWYGDGNTEAALLANAPRWFAKNDAFDAAIRARFEGAVHAAATGALDTWRDVPAPCLAFVILLDQFPRNLYRGTPRAFGFDLQALAASLRAQALGLDRDLPLAYRVFLYMPMMHAEDAEVQRACVARFEALAAEAPDDVAASYQNNLVFAQRHAEIVERFGRFPHRNAVLSRASTPAEIAFLDEPMSSF